MGRPWLHEAALDFRLRDEHGVRVYQLLQPLAQEHELVVDVASEALPEDVQARPHRLYDNLPARNTLVHGDFHTGNMMVQDGEIVLIDTDDVAQGDPIVDMAGMELTFGFITTDERAMHTMRMTVDETRRYYDAFLREYYGTDDEALLQRYGYQSKLHSLVKALYGIVKTSTVPEPLRSQFIARTRGGLEQLMDAMGV